MSIGFIVFVQASHARLAINKQTDRQTNGIVIAWRPLREVRA